MKQKPVYVEQPRFVRDNMIIDDIPGARSRSIYKGVAKNILETRDIDGNIPKHMIGSPVSYKTISNSPINRLHQLEGKGTS